MSLPLELSQWLYRVLQPEYVNHEKTFTDSSLLLVTYKNLKPRTRIYINEQGAPNLLLNIYGSLPTTINNKVYKIPIEIWLPKSYPAESPIVYVTPTEKMNLQPGNHVDNNGKCYSFSLSNWKEFSNILNVLQELSLNFSAEPPVYAKPVVQLQQKPQQLQRPTGPLKEVQSPPPLPPIPAELRQSLLKSSSPSLTTALENGIKQLNFMDEVIDNKNDDILRFKSITSVENILQNIYDLDVFKRLEKTKLNVSGIQSSIGKFDKIFEFEFNEIDGLEQQISINSQILSEKKTKALQTINESNSFGAINVDEIISTETVLYTQLYDLVSHDLAIEDTLYTLTKSFDHGNIPLQTFIKYTRNLSREQFMNKALIRKISKLLNLDISQVH
ncbi:hypothetical protein WICMUC_004725 [Wickerhamomyces mucosus]|uniref:UEV domain-containing protein n=1 Tax=Wickerhamomyces mucosus TaxID=1378264 RepID=A0A9P8T9C6_9ASCO|nr:hypothetical protein WICMUC_004725 [Wickerhamomyces mucosus]